MELKESYEEAIKQLRTEIGGLEYNLHQKNVELWSHQDKLAQLNCPFKVGDIIRCNERDCEVTRITRSRYGGIYTVWGKWILKGGFLGKEEHELYGVVTPVK